MIIVLKAGDIQKVARVASSKAYDMKNEVNAYTISKGIKVYSQDTCLARHFCELYGFTREELNAKLEGEKNE